jgi:hypothetical protein
MEALKVKSVWRFEEEEILAFLEGEKTALIVPVLPQPPTLLHFLKMNKDGKTFTYERALKRVRWVWDDVEKIKNNINKG